MINLFDNYSFNLFNPNISKMLGFSYTETDVYFARKTADEYGAITTDDDFGAAKNQIDYDNRLASNLQRQEINDTKTATDKTNNRQARRDSNNDFTNYYEALLALQTTYEIAIATADETYWVKYIDVKTWTPLQTRGFIGAGTAGGSETRIRMHICNF
jgi:hypothetical protein